MSMRPARVGLVVSKAVGNAVVRNRVKRRLRHQAAPLVGTLPAGTSVVVRALPPAASSTSAELAEELRAGLTRCLSRTMVTS
jgi:ribonuclease P protein component